MIETTSEAAFPTGGIFQSPPVEAYQINYDNFNDIARWCRAKPIANVMEEDGSHRAKMLVRIGYGDKKRSIPASSGDWVVLEEGGAFRVFRDRAFKKAFRVVEMSQGAEESE